MVRKLSKKQIIKDHNNLLLSDYKKQKDSIQKKISEIKELETKKLKELNILRDNKTELSGALKLLETLENNLENL